MLRHSVGFYTTSYQWTFVLIADMVDNQRQQAEERALKMKGMLVKTKKELAEAKKQVRVLPKA